MLVGDDVRPRKVYNQIMKHFHSSEISCVPDNNADFQNTKLLRTVEQYADIILSSHDQSILAKRPFWQYCLPVEVPGETLAKVVANQRPQICSNANAMATKGTGLFLGVIQELECFKLRYDIRFHSNVLESSMLYSFAVSDIVIENLRLPMYGKTAVQAMMLGCIPVTSCNVELMPFPENRPTWKVTAKNIGPRVLELLQMPNSQRFSLQQECINFSNRHHSAGAFVEGVAELLNGNRPNASFEIAHKSTFLEYAESNGIFLVNK